MVEKQHLATTLSRLTLYIYTYTRYILLLKLSLKIIYYLHFHWLAVLGVNRIKRYTDHQINWLESRE